MSDALAGITKIGFDTSPFIYFVERHPVYLPAMRNIIEKVDKGAITGCCSVITLTEVLVHPRRSGAALLEKEYSDLLRNSQNFKLIPIDADIADHAADLRCHYNLRTPDALQVAAVLSVGCEAFLTNDKQLKQIEAIKVILLDEYLQET